MLRILNYIHARRTMVPITGVGQHILNMSLTLAHWPAVEQILLASAPEIRLQPTVDPTWALRGLPTRTFPCSRKMMERLWWFTHAPKADRWFPEADWVYAGADVFIPTRRARFALTIHDIYYFEEDLPWSNTPEHLKARKSWKIRLRPMLKHADAILTVSEFSKRRIVEVLGINANRIFVVGNGIDPNEFNENLSPDPEFAKGPPYLLVIGGLTLRKGAVPTLELGRKLVERKSNIRIIVAGKSQPQYTEQAHQLPNMLDLGYTAAERLPGLVRGALGLLFFSRYEGFGIPIVEAFACGTPAIISEYSSLPEVGGNAAIVLHQGQMDEVVDKVERMASDPAYRESVVQLGRPIAEKYTWHNCVQRLINAFQARM